MFVYHFVDPDLRFETFFEKEGAAENGGFNFEIRDIGNSAKLHWRLKKIHAEPVGFFITFLAFKSSLDLYFHPFIIEFF